MKEVLPGQWKIAGYVVFAGDGSRIELARTESLEDAFSPKRKKKRRKQRKGQRKRGRASRRLRNERREKKAIGRIGGQEGRIRRRCG